MDRECSNIFLVTVPGGGMGASLNCLNPLVFQAPPATYGNDKNLIWLDVHIPRKNTYEKIPAFYIYRGRDKLTLLFSHSNAEDLGTIVNYFSAIAHDLRVNVFAYEYTGYGVSTGIATEENVYACVQAAYEYLRYKMEVPWQKIVLYGRSIGSGPSVWLASRELVRGLILQSAITSVARVFLPFRKTPPGDMFPNIDRIGQVKCPVYIIHGVKDSIVPVSHAQELYNRCQRPATPHFVEAADHNDVEVVAQADFMRNLKAFLRHLEEYSDGVGTLTTAAGKEGIVA